MHLIAHSYSVVIWCRSFSSSIICNRQVLLHSKLPYDLFESVWPCTSILSLSLISPTLLFNVIQFVLFDPDGFCWVYYLIFLAEVEGDLGIQNWQFLNPPASFWRILLLLIGLEPASCPPYISSNKFCINGKETSFCQPVKRIPIQQGWAMWTLLLVGRK